MHIFGDMREEMRFLEAQGQPQHEGLELGGHCPKGGTEERLPNPPACPDFPGRITAR